MKLSNLDLREIDCDAIRAVCACGATLDRSPAEAAAEAETLIGLAALGCGCGDGGRIESIRLIGLRRPPDPDAPF